MSRRASHLSADSSRIAGVLVDPAADAAMLQQQLGLRPDCVAVMQLASELLRAGVKAELSLHQIGRMMIRPSQRQHSELERLYLTALKLARNRRLVTRTESAEQAAGGGPPIATESLNIPSSSAERRGAGASPEIEIGRRCSRASSVVSNASSSGGGLRRAISAPGLEPLGAGWLGRTSSGRSSGGGGSSGGETPQPGETSRTRRAPPPPPPAPATSDGLPGIDSRPDAISLLLLARGKGDDTESESDEDDTTDEDFTDEEDEATQAAWATLAAEVGYAGGIAGAVSAPARVGTVREPRVRLLSQVRRPRAGCANPPAAAVPMACHIFDVTASKRRCNPVYLTLHATSLVARTRGRRI